MISSKDDIYILEIDSVSGAHDGDYMVKAENASGSVQTSANLSVQAEENVNFVKTLEDVEIKEKTTLELDVEVTTEQPGAVKWYKDGEPITPASAEAPGSGAGSDDEGGVAKNYEFKSTGRKHSIVIKNATVHNEGEYVATIGEQECSCELTVVELPPEFVRKIEPVKATVGEEKAVFEVELSKGDAMPKWYKNGAEIELSDANKCQVKIDGKKQRLEIYNLETTDAGEFSCSIGDKKCEAKLEVEEPRVNFLAKLPETTESAVGQDVKITVQMTKETDKVEWLKNGEPLSFTESSTKYCVEKRGTTQAIIIKDASIADIAEYTCVAENVKTRTELELKAASKDEKEEKVEVTETSNKEQVCRKGQDMTFKVKLSGNQLQKPKVTWLFKGQEITSSERIVTCVSRTEASITVRQVENVDCGAYTVKISNSSSLVSVDFNLCIKDKPSAPRGPASVESKSDNSIELRWNCPESDGGATVTEYIVERREVTKKSWKQVGLTNQTWIEIKGLKKDSSYNFRVIAKNSVGCSQAFILEETYSGAADGSGMGSDVKTSKSASNLAASASSSAVASGAQAVKMSLPGSPGLSVKDVTSRSVTLQWTPPSNTGGVELTSYIIEKTLFSVASWEKVATVENTVTEYTVENLKEKGEYLFRVAAENEVGAGEAAKTDKICLKTNARPPSSPTAPLEISAVTPHSITVEWGAPESDGGAPLEGYKVAVRDAKRQMWMEVGRVSAEVQRLKVQDLSEGNEYFIRIFAKNEVGFSDPLENEEPFKVVRPADYKEEEEDKDAKADETPSLSFTTETLSSWMREAQMDANIQSYTKSSVLRRDEYFFRLWYYASKLFK